MALDSWSETVLWHVCHWGPYRSSVHLAIDLDDVGKLYTRPDNGVLVVELALRELNVEGLVLYSEAVHQDLPFTRVRATQRGFEFVGLPRPVRVVGASRPEGGFLPDHPGDGTDWRVQPGHAPGGPVESMSLEAHVFAYPDHAWLHYLQLQERRGYEMADAARLASDGTRRTGPQVTDAAERAKRDQEIRRLAFDKGVSQAQLGRRFGLTESAIGNILESASTKRRVLDFLEAHPDESFKVRDISSALHMDINKIQFMVDALRKRGLVEAKTAGGDEANGHRAFGDIRLRKASKVKPHRQGQVGKDYTDPSSHGSKANGGPIERTRVTPAIEELFGAPLAQLAEEKIEAETIASDIAAAHESERELISPVLGLTPRLSEADVEDLARHVTVDEVSAELDALEAKVPLEETLLPSEAARYPLLERLLERDSKIAQAAKLLEQVGLDDLAIAALQKQDDFTPLEREYVRFAVAHAKP